MYFDDATLPPKLEWVETDFPFPLALTFARMRVAFARQQPVEAVWAVRDAWEVAIKFCACVSVADFLNADPDRPTAEKVAAGLLSDRGVAIGGWKDALVLTLPEPNATGRRLPALRDVFRKPGGSRTTAHFQATDAFPAWRNDVFGHGVFKQDVAWYAAQAAEWAKKLVALYAALRPVFDGWVLVGRTADGQTVDWSGCEFEPKRDRHQHDPLGHALPLFLASGGTELSFGPLLSVQRCKGCDHPAAFFFDRQKTADQTLLLEYFAGTKGTRSGWAEVDALKRWLPTEFKWERRLYDTGELLDGIPILFRDFDREYLRPAYLLDAIGRRLDATQKGYVLLDGPEGVGKSYLARGLAEKETDLGLKVLAYYVRPGDLSHFASFLIELNRQVHDKLLPANKRTFEPQAKGAKTAGELQAEFVEYFTTVLAGRSGAVLVIDGLDELPDADPTTPLITDLLPDADKLPPNLHIVLTARGGELKPRAAARWHELAAGALRLTLDPASADNRALVGEYLERESTAAVADILDRSGGVFLYAWHFVAALRQGVFAGTADLPPAEQFYPAFLDRIRRRVGDSLFEAVYLKLLMVLTAARVPVTREQIERWGIPADRLATALNDLRDFVRQLRHRDWHEGMGDDAEPRYKIAHEAFVRYAEAHEAERVKDAHRTIATAALRHNETKWEGLDPADDGDLYDVRFVLWHCDAAWMTAEAEGLRGEDVLARTAKRIAYRLWEVARHILALELSQQSEGFYRDLVENRTRPELANRLAGTLMNKGNALSQLGRLAEAVGCQDEASAILRDLMDNENRPELAEDLYAALMNKGNLLDALGSPGDALECHDEVIAILRDLVENEGRSELANDLAMALTNKGNVLNDLGRLDEAVECHEEAIAIRRHLVQNEDRSELADHLAIALNNQGIAIRKLNRLDEAVECADEAIAIFRDLVENEGRSELANDLAMALNNKGIALRWLGRLVEAVGCANESIAIRRHLVGQQNRPELAIDLAKALVNKGNLLTGLGRPGEAVGFFDEAIAVYRQVIQNQGRTDLASELACHLICKGAALNNLGRLPEAAGCHDEAITALHHLFELPRYEVLPDLLLAYVNRLGVAVESEDWPAAARIFLQGVNAVVTKAEASELTPRDQQRYDQLLDRIRRLTPEQHSHMFNVPGEDGDALRQFFDEP